MPDSQSLSSSPSSSYSSSSSAVHSCASLRQSSISSIGTNNFTTQLHDVLIVGAGPCGLAVAARLRESTPSALFADFEHQRYHWLRRHSSRQRPLPTKGRANNLTIADGKDTRLVKAHCVKSYAYNIRVLDATSNRWLGKWDAAFETLAIPTLRSPLFFHPSPADRDGLKEFAQVHDRLDELDELKNICGKEMSKHQKKKAMKRKAGKDQPRGTSIDERDKQDYFTPSTKLFADFCADTVNRYGLQDTVAKADVQSLAWYVDGEGDRPDGCFEVKTSAGVHFARAVVLAVGPGIPNSIPANAAASEGACHSSQLGALGQIPAHVRARIASRRATNVIVVGGGLTSAQIADMVLKRGVSKVYHIMRSEYKLKHFDLDLPWVAKYKNFQLAAFFGLENDRDRADMIQKARNGGSITPAFDKMLAKHIVNKRLERHVKTTIVKKIWHPLEEYWTVHTEPELDLPAIDYIYYATGAKADIAELPLMREMMRDHPIEIANGLPCLTDELQWKTDVPLFVAGRYAGLRLGPGAANLEGARTGAERIACRLQEVLEERDRLDGCSLGFCGSECDRKEDSWADFRQDFERGASHCNLYSALEGYGF